MNGKNVSNFRFQISNGCRGRVNALGIREVEPWHEVVDGRELLDELADVLTRFVVLPRHAAQTLALWVVHTYAFELRDVATYIGIESPEKRCGKTTLLAVLSELVCRPVVAANISSPAFFRVIEELRPTLLIDEADTFLQGNEELRGILNSGYARSTAFVVRVANESSTGGNREEELLTEGNEGNEGGNALASIITNHKLQITKPEGGSRLASFSCWCPKVMAAIGRLPDTLADRCIVIRMQRKSVGESCERLRLLEAEVLRRKCARFVADHREVIAMARPQVPEELNDRAADIWEPLLVLADLADKRVNHQEQTRTSNVQLPTSNVERGELQNEANADDSRKSNIENVKGWAVLAREAAVCLTGIAQENNPIGSLLMDILYCFSVGKAERLFSRTLAQQLNYFSNRPWNEMTRTKTKDALQGVTEVWLARVLRPYGVRPSTTRIGEAVAKGYSMEDFEPVFQRYIPMSEVDDFRARLTAKSPEQVEQEAVAKELEKSKADEQAKWERVKEMARLGKEFVKV